MTLQEEPPTVQEQAVTSQHETVTSQKVPQTDSQQHVHGGEGSPEYFSAEDENIWEGESHDEEGDRVVITVD